MEYPLPELPATLGPGIVLGDCMALSIRQPWAAAVVLGSKDIENRVWRTSYRGRVLIHASQGMNDDDVDGFRDLVTERKIAVDWPNGLLLRDLLRGGIVGEAEIVDCVSSSDSPWFVGPRGFVLRNAKPLPFTPCRGELGFFMPVAGVTTRVSPSKKKLDTLQTELLFL